MQTRITARRIDISDGLRTHIEQSLGKLDKYHGDIQDAHVVIAGDNGTALPKTADITVTVPRGQFRANHAADSHQDAVSDCVRQIRRQVIRHKDRQRSQKQDRYR